MKNNRNWQFRSYRLVWCRMLVVVSIVFVCTASATIAQSPAAKHSGYDENGQYWQYSDQSDSANKSKESSEGSDKSATGQSELGEEPLKRELNWREFLSSQPSTEDDSSFDMTAEEEEMSSTQDLLLGPGRWIYNTRIGKNLAKHQNVDIRRRPMMYWRRFADRPVPPRGTFLFFVFFNSLICLAFKKRVEVASSCVRKSFWKSLFVGFIFVILMGIAARFCFDSALFTPAALLILGIVQLLVLAGLAVSSMTVGTAILNRLGVTTMSVSEAESVSHSAHSFVERLKCKLHYLAPVILSSVLVTLISLIPTLGFLPRMGTRFVMWFCVLGLGALIRTKLGRKPL